MCVVGGVEGKREAHPCPQDLSSRGPLPVSHSPVEDDRKAAPAVAPSPWCGSCGGDGRGRLLDPFQKQWAVRGSSAEVGVALSPGEPG